MNSEYSSFFNIDFSKLPSEVLKSIDYAARKELEKRRRAKMVDSKEFTSNASKTEKIFKKLLNRTYNKHLLSYLDALLLQDWSHLFSGDETRKYYVYFHITPNTNRIFHESEILTIKTEGTPFYVGKGTGNRAYDLNRNQGHGVILKQLKSNNINENDIVHIVKDLMTEPEALELESKLIYFFGTRYEKGRRGLLVNLDIPKRIEVG